MAIGGEIGTTGLAEFSGQIQEDFLRELRGGQAYKRYNEMRLNSPIVGALLLAIEQPIRGMSVQVISDLGEDDPRIELVNLSLKAIGWNDHLSEALTMLPFGYSLCEIVYQRVDGNIQWSKFAPRGQDTVSRWLFDETGKLIGFEQSAAPRYKLTPIPAEKLLHYRTRSEKNNPEGRSILRTAWIPYYYQKNISQVEAIGIERDLAGLPVVKLPEGADTADTDTSDLGKARKLARNIRNDEQAGVTLPSGWDLLLLSTGGSRQFDTNAVIQRYESRVLMSCLAQFLMLGQDRVGTQALSKDQTDFFTMSVNAIADIIIETINKQALPRLMALNGYDAEGLRLEHTPAGDIDLPALADFLQKVGSMITWLPSDEAWLRNVARLPEADPVAIEEERLRKQAISQAIMQRAQQQPEREKPPEEGEEIQEEEEEMGLELFAAIPNDEERRLWEGRYKRLWTTFLEGQMERVLKGAKRV